MTGDQDVSRDSKSSNHEKQTRIHTETNNTVIKDKKKQHNKKINYKDKRDEGKQINYYYYNVM